jgi:hypothetical protein
MREQLTSEQARSFERFSATNAAIVASSLPCGCVPYVDVFTFNRWRAQGRVVRKGEHAVKIHTYAPITDKETGQVIGKRPWRSAVFCRHQTDEVAAFLRAQ